MNRFIFLLILTMISWSVSSGSAFPQEQQNDDVPPIEGHTAASNDFDEDEAALQDMGDRYEEMPVITGELSCQCGRPSPRIIGGEDADIDQYPWTALLYSVESDTLRIPYCGGALINNLYILTAGHCVDGLQPKMVEVVLREQNLSTMIPPDMDTMMEGRASLKAIRIEVDKFIQHPNYSRNTLDNDIALIKMKIRVPLEDFPLAPICVPQEEVSFPQGLCATVAGYGAMSESSGKSSTNLQVADVRVLSNEFCNSMQYHRGKVSTNMLCADGNGKGPCGGDTGGPLMVRSAPDSSRQVLAGIASWSTTCNDKTTPNVYTRVPGFESWISENTKDAKWCRN